MRTIVTADVGGTNARFAIAEINSGQVTRMTSPVNLKTGDFASLQSAWREFESRMGSGLPPNLAMAFAGPVDGETLKLTNNPWRIRRDQLASELKLDRLLVVNDFGAVAHAVAETGVGDFQHICGPDAPLPESGVITVVGPGTGLGVAILVRDGGGAYEVIPTEGGHIDFAPLDPLEDRLLRELRSRLRRVSVERLVAGPGLANIYEMLGLIENRSVAIRDDRSLWEAALSASEPLASDALERFVLMLGSVCGDLALAQGAAGVVVAGGVGLRLKDYLPGSGFRERFVAKGRFEARMAGIPVKVLTRSDAGLFGAAVAFAHAHP